MTETAESEEVKDAAEEAPTRRYPERVRKPPDRLNYKH